MNWHWCHCTDAELLEQSDIIEASDRESKRPFLLINREWLFLPEFELKDFWETPFLIETVYKKLCTVFQDKKYKNHRRQVAVLLRTQQMPILETITALLDFIKDIYTSSQSFLMAAHTLCN